MPEADAIDVLLRLQGLRKFIADAEAARASISKISATAAEASAGGAAGAAGGASNKKSAAAQAGALGLVRKAAIGTGLAVAGVGFEATKMGIKFDESMTKLVTQTNESKKNVALLETGVLKMARSVGIGPQSLSEGLYHLESIGIRGKKALEALKTAADLAAVGGANLEDTATGIGSAFIVGIKGAGDFTHVAALMNAAVGSGNIRMQALAEALGQGILPAAQIAGLSLQNVFAAIATLTDAGYKASSASAQLATAFHYLYAPTGKATKALAEMHLTGLDLIKTMRTRGLPAALKELRSHLNEFSKDPNVQAVQLSKIIPGGRGRTLLALSGPKLLPRLEEKERVEQQATNKKWAEAVSTYHKTAAYQIRAAWAGVQADMIKVGKILEPVAIIAAKALLGLADAVLWLGKSAKDAINWVKNASPPVKALALIVGIFLGQVILFTAMVRAWYLLRAGIDAAKLAMQLFSQESRLALLATPWGVIIMVLVGFIVLIATHWERTKQIAAAVWKWMVTAWKNTVDWVISAAESVFNWFKKNWPTLRWFIIGPLGVALEWVIKNWGGIAKFFESFPEKVKAAFKSLGKAILSPFKWAFDQVANLWNKIPTPIKALIGAAIGGAVGGPLGALAGGLAGGGVIGDVKKFLGLAEGGTITSPGSVVVGERGPEILNLPRGASVQPLDGSGRPEAGSFTAKAHTTVMLDRKVLAEAVGTFTSDKMNRR